MIMASSLELEEDARGFQALRLPGFEALRLSGFQAFRLQAVILVLIEGFGRSKHEPRTTNHSYLNF